MRVAGVPIRTKCEDRALERHTAACLCSSRPGHAGTAGYMGPIWGPLLLSYSPESTAGRGTARRGSQRNRSAAEQYFFGADTGAQEPLRRGAGDRSLPTG
eukprot:7161075-Pyramimonas_sp.AAC.1